MPITVVTVCMSVRAYVKLKLNTLNTAGKASRGSRAPTPT